MGLNYIGKSVPRIDAAAKVKGEALFASDMVMPDQAHMKMLMSRRPHAIVKSMDTSKAEAFPGVPTLLTSQDVHSKEFGYFHTTNRRSVGLARSLSLTAYAT